MVKDAAVQNIKVSVVIPIFNMEKYIEQCVRSIMEQSLKEIEIICIDDGSTDKSPEILKRLAEQDKRILIHRQENSGVAVARNEGIKIAKGEYLSILDADDFFDTDMLLNSYESAIENNSDICIFRAKKYNEETDETSPLESALRDNFLPKPDTKILSPDDICDRLFSFVTLWAWDKLFKRDFIINNEIIFQNQRTTNDAGFVAIALALSKKINICDTAFAIHRYNRKNSLSVTREKSWSCFNEAFKFIEARLKKEGLFEKYFHAMQNWVIDFAIWNYETISGPHKKDVYNLIRREIFPKYEIWNHPEDYYVWHDRYYKSQLIKIHPYNCYEKSLTAVARKHRIKNLWNRFKGHLIKEGPLVTLFKICRKIFRKVFRKRQKAR